MSKLIFVATATLALVGCANPETVPVKRDGGVEQPRDDTTFRVWTDPQTGCDYLMAYGNPTYGAFPRVSSDGYTVLCADQKIIASEPSQ